LTALGITLMVIGTTIDWKVWSPIGFVITVVCAIIWIRDTRRDVASLPEEHHH
jgi:multidrug transporter EmrE-like cation transporter